MATRDFKEESLRHFDRIAHRYDSHHYSMQTRRVHKVVRTIVDELKPTSLIDVGCGNGGFLAILNAENCKLAGADLSPEMIKYAREKLGESVDLRVADSEHLPWDTDTFDCITCNFSFHHYPNPAAVLQEMRRVLKPGGYLVISDPWFPSFFLYFANLAVRFSKLGDVRMYPLNELRSLLTAAGFNVERLDRRIGSSFSVGRKSAV